MYRIRHIPTGLYYIPSRDVKAPGWSYGLVKSNLSKTGKAYVRRPSIKSIGSSIYSHLAVAPPPDGVNTNRMYHHPRTAVIQAPASDWEIVSE